MNPFDLVMFDLDGTLIETAPEILDAVNDTLAHFGLPLVRQQQVNDWIGHGTQTLLVRALAFSQQIPTAAVQVQAQWPSMADAFQHHYQQRCGTRSHLYPQVRETLTALRARGVGLAIVTNKEARFTRTVLDAHALGPLFHRVVSGDTLATKKPSPEGIQDCLQHFSVAADRALFVGDSSIDVQTARNAGVQVWALPYGYNMGRPIAESHPDRLGDHVGCLLAEPNA